jgi:PKD repeat protein
LFDRQSQEGGRISPKRKLALVATTAAVVLIIVVVGLASLAPKSKPESVNRSPVADFSYEASNLTVAFNASASNDPDGTIANFSWSFGDDTEGNGMIVSHEFPANGTYQVALTVTDNGNAKNTTKKGVTVELAVEPVKEYPVAVIKIVWTDNLTVNLSGEDSLAPKDGSIVSYNWSFEGGGSATGVSVTHTFAANGTYNVTLTVTDNLGETNSTTIKVTVSLTPPPPPPPPPPHQDGPPGLLHAIEIHKLKADRNKGLLNSLGHLESNLDRWLKGNAAELEA